MSFKKSLGVTLETPVEKDCFAIIKTSSDNSNIENASNSNVSNTVIGGAATKQQTAIALAPTGFASWTKKIKENVCKFFDYLPKLISGNYKRNIDNNFIDNVSLGKDLASYTADADITLRVDIWSATKTYIQSILTAENYRLPAVGMMPLTFHKVFAILQKRYTQC